MLESRKATFAGGAVFALVLGSGTAYAATGGNFILGKANKAGAVSTLENTRGPALRLKSPSNRAPLKVSNSNKIFKLNADLLDGHSSGAFARVSGQTGYIESSGRAFDDDQNGFPDYLIAIATCPSGTTMTGGGSADVTSTGLVVMSAPSDGNSWAVATVTDNATSEDPKDLVASVVCYNPTGSVVGAAAAAQQRTSRQSIPDGMLTRLQDRTAAAR